MVVIVAIFSAFVNSDAFDDSVEGGREKTEVATSVPSPTNCISLHTLYNSIQYHLHTLWWN